MYMVSERERDLKKLAHTIVMASRSEVSGQVYNLEIPVRIDTVWS